MRRVGILTSGGDCQGLNAAIRGVAKALHMKSGAKMLRFMAYRMAIAG